MDWTDSTGRLRDLHAEIRRLRARALRWNAPETAQALDEALRRAEVDLARSRPPGDERRPTG